jgi:hypothetical protein
MPVQLGVWLFDTQVLGWQQSPGTQSESAVHAAPGNVVRFAAVFCPVQPNNITKARTAINRAIITIAVFIG